MGLPEPLSLFTCLYSLFNPDGPACSAAATRTAYLHVCTCARMHVCACVHVAGLGEEDDEESDEGQAAYRGADEDMSGWLSK